MRLILFFALAVCALTNITAHFFPEILPLSIVKFINPFAGGLAVVTAIPGTDGANFFGSKNMALGPCNVYLGTQLNPAKTGTATNTGSALTGTVAVSGTTVTGTGTTFTVDLVVGDYVLLGSSSIAKVTAIASATSMTIDTSYTISSGASIKKAITTVTGSGTAFSTEFAVGDYITSDGLTYAKITAIASATALTIDAATLLLNASAIRKFTAINLGGVDGVTIKSTTKKVGLQEAQYGESDADAVVTGGECSIELSITRSSLDRLAAIMQGFETHKTAGVYDGYGLGVALGENDSDILKQLSVVKIVGGVESTNPMDTFHFPKVAPKTEAEWKYDAKTQRLTKSMFTAYRSADHVLNGKELFGYSGTIV